MKRLLAFLLFSSSLAWGQQAPVVSQTDARAPATGAVCSAPAQVVFIRDGARKGKTLCCTESRWLECGATGGGGGTGDAGSWGAIAGGEATTQNFLVGTGATLEPTGGGKLRTSLGERYARQYATAGAGTSGSPWSGWSGAIAANTVTRLEKGTYLAPSPGAALPTGASLACEKGAIIRLNPLHTAETALDNGALRIAAGVSDVAIDGCTFDVDPTDSNAGEWIGTSIFVSIGTTGDPVPARNVSITNNTFGPKWFWAGGNGTRPAVPTSKPTGNDIRIYGSATNVTIAHNRFSNAHWNIGTIRGHPTVQYVLEGFSVTDNVVETTDECIPSGEPCSYYQSFVSIGDTGAGYTYETYGKGLNVSNNIVRWATGIVEWTIPFDGFTVSGNQLVTNTGNNAIDNSHGIPNAGRNMTITGNVLTTDTGTGTWNRSSAAIIVYRVNGLTISGNTLRSDYLASIRAVEGQNVTITGNTVDAMNSSSRDGIALWGVSGATVTGNVLRDIWNGAYAVRLSNSSGAANTGVLVANNLAMKTVPIGVGESPFANLDAAATDVRIENNLCAGYTSGACASTVSGGARLANNRTQADTGETITEDFTLSAPKFTVTPQAVTGSTWCDDGTDSFPGRFGINSSSPWQPAWCDVKKVCDTGDHAGTLCTGGLTCRGHCEGAPEVACAYTSTCTGGTGPCVGIGQCVPGSLRHYVAEGDAAMGAKRLQAGTQAVREATPCTVGDTFFETDADPAGQNIYACTATDTWTLAGDGGAGSYLSLSGGTLTGAVDVGTGSRIEPTGTGVVVANVVDAVGNAPLVIGSSDVPSITLETLASGTGSVVLPLQSVEGAEIVSDTLGPTQIDETAVYSFTNLRGKQKRNGGTAVNDNVCDAADQGSWWYDSTDQRFEFCNAASGAPTLLGGGATGGNAFGLITTPLGTYPTADQAEDTLQMSGSNGITVTGSLAATSVIVGCTTATGSVPGCLAAADWTAFNGKQAGLTYPVTGAAATTVDTLPKWTGTNTLGDGLKLGTMTDTKYCTYTTANGLVCNAEGTGNAPLDFKTITVSGTPAVADMAADTLTLTGTAPITIVGSGDDVVTVACNAAGTSQPGCLSPADWNTFNGKQPLDSTLTSIAGLTIADVSILEGTQAETMAVVTSGGAYRYLRSNVGNTALEFAADFAGNAATATALSANQGATTTVLHGNAAGTPAFAGITATDFTANQGTTTTVLHGNAAGKPAFGAIVDADVPDTITASNYLPLAGGTLTGAVTAPILSGKQKRNTDAIADNDCTGELGSWWFDSTQGRFEFCNANSGAPATLAASSGTVSAVGDCTTGECFTDAGAGSSMMFHGANSGAATVAVDANTTKLTIGVPVEATSFTAGASASAGGYLYLAEGSNNGTAYVGFTAPASIATAGGTCVLRDVVAGAGMIPASCVNGKLSDFSATTSAELDGVISDDTGSGSLVFATSPTLVTPALGAATATTINGNAITSGTGTLTLSTYTLTVANTASVAGTNTGDQTNVAGTAASFTGSLTGAVTSTGMATTVAELNNLAADVAYAVTPVATGLLFQGATANAYETTLTGGDPTADRTLALPNDSGTLLVNTQKHTECFTLLDRTSILATDDIPSIWKAPAAVTITGVSCESDASNGVVLNLGLDGACDTAALVTATTLTLTSDVTCTTVMSAGTVNASYDNYAAGDCMDLVIVSIGTTPKRLNVCVEYTYD